MSAGPLQTVCNRFLFGGYLSTKQGIFSFLINLPELLPYSFCVARIMHFLLSLFSFYS